MTTYRLAFKPAIGLYGQHDPSAVLFDDGEPVFGIEEERLSRQKHAKEEFPERAIRACLDHADIDLDDLDRVILPYDPKRRTNILGHYLRATLAVEGVASKAVHLERTIRSQLRARFRPEQRVRRHLRQFDGTVPRIDRRPHHRCHAASAFHPAPFDEALVVTMDAKGEADSTVLWYGDLEGLERLETYHHPNSLGLFFGVVTEYLGYRMFNGEGKVMGLAPYGTQNPEIERKLRSLVEVGPPYDVTALTRRWGTDAGVQRLESVLGRPRNDTPGEFDQWQADLAYTAQSLLEEMVLGLVEEASDTRGVRSVCFAGGVALNCKMNRRVRSSPSVENLFVQPVAHDAGLALGAGWLDQPPGHVEPRPDVYLGPAPDDADVESLLDESKLVYSKPQDVESAVAEKLADGALVGWFQGRTELGPRALGNRSILADPRTTDSRDRVNEHVKHREEWRPFAPSILAEAADEYLVDPYPAPYMIDTFEVRPEKREEIPAVLHPADDTTRPQLVSRDDNPRYHDLISAFEARTGVPVLLNTSFNDNGEPIVNTPREAVRTFFAMGLDMLVLGDYLVEKTRQTTSDAAGRQIPSSSFESRA